MGFAHGYSHGSPPGCPVANPLPETGLGLSIRRAFTILDRPLAGNQSSGVVGNCLVAKHMKIESSEQPVEKLPYAKPAIQELGDLKTHTLAAVAIGPEVDMSSVAPL